MEAGLKSKLLETINELKKKFVIKLIVDSINSADLKISCKKIKIVRLQCENKFLNKTIIMRYKLNEITTKMHYVYK